jgi:predicted nucleotidyltransferase
MDTFEPDRLFTALVGSHNYNLTTETSDKDYIGFLIPSYDDLYKGAIMPTKESKIDGNDVKLHDIRRLPEYLWKANTSFAELLFSSEVHIDDVRYVAFIDEIFARRNDLVTMNLPYLYNSMRGLMHEVGKTIVRKTGHNDHVIDQYGYDVKRASHIYRSGVFLIRFARTHDFETAFRFPDNDPMRAYLLNIKTGNIPHETFQQHYAHLVSDIDAIRPAYHTHQPDPSVRDEVNDLIKRLVKCHVLNTL